MDPSPIATDWSLIIQGVVQILTIIGSLWAIISKKTSDIDHKFNSRLLSIEQQVKMSNQLMQQREQIVKPSKFDV